MDRIKVSSWRDWLERRPLRFFSVFIAGMLFAGMLFGFLVLGIKNFWKSKIQTTLSNLSEISLPECNNWGTLKCSVYIDQKSQVDGAQGILLEARSTDFVLVVLWGKKINTKEEKFSQMMGNIRLMNGVLAADFLPHRQGLIVRRIEGKPGVNTWKQIWGELEPILAQEIRRVP